MDHGYYCDKCGSTQVEVKMYVNPNTLEVEDNPEFESDEPCWCYNCQDNTHITNDPDELKSWDELNKGDEIRDYRKEQT